jgi:hypothetical protein
LSRLGERRALLEVVSAAAVVASLVFVGLEIQQNTAAQRSQTRQAISDASSDFLLRLAEDEEVMAAWHGIWDAPGGQDVWRGTDNNEHQPLTHMDTIRAETAMLALVRRLENVYLQHGEGVFGRTVLDNYSFNSPVYQTPQFERWWKTIPFARLFDSSFVREFEEANALR